MSTDGTVEQGQTPPLPTSIRVLAWTSVAGAVVPLVAQGVRRDPVSLVVSVLIGALLVGYVAAGVVRARTVRLGLAWLVLSLAFVFGALGLFFPYGQDVVPTILSLTVTGVSLAALERFRRTAWYAWQRTKPATALGAPITGLVAIGALAGALGGLVDQTADPTDMSVDTTVRVAER